MKASWNGQICKSEGKYSIQFETDNYYLYRHVEKACQDAVDIKDTYNNPELGRIMGLRWDGQSEIGGDANGERTDV